MTCKLKLTELLNSPYPIDKPGFKVGDKFTVEVAYAWKAKWNQNMVDQVGTPQASKSKN